MGRKQYEVAEQKFLNQKASAPSMNLTSVSEYVSDMGFYDSKHERMDTDIERSLVRIKASKQAQPH